MQTDRHDVKCVDLIRNRQLTYIWNKISLKSLKFVHKASEVWASRKWLGYLETCSWVLTYKGICAHLLLSSCQYLDLPFNNTILKQSEPKRFCEDKEPFFGIFYLFIKNTLFWRIVVTRPFDLQQPTQFISGKIRSVQIVHLSPKLKLDLF